MKETEKAYLAGLMDGEGSISLLHWVPKGHDKPRVMPMVRIGMHSKKAVGYMASIVGKKIYHQSGPKGVYTCQLTHKDAVDFLTTIMPYLITKKPQAKFFVSFYKIAFSKSYRGGGSSVPDHIVRIRSLGAEIMKLLNEHDAMTFHGKSDEFSEHLTPLLNAYKGMITLSQAAEGYGSAEGATTTEMSPNNNSPHERPALTH